jgi:valyl-tRNA synthetase
VDKTYNPKEIEKRWSQYWETHHLGKPSGNGEPYCIMLPPPNVTGTLHMGHGFQQTLMDTLVRHKRMQGYRTLWQGGTDHAGIATQMVVERQLAQEGYSRLDLGRESFIKRVWLWREQSGNIITQQMRRLGVSIDWSRERFSMDEGISQATTEAFVRLYREGLIYRGQKLVNWDPSLKTAISDLEVEMEEVQGEIWFIRYPLVDGKDHLTVATTRPETLLGDVAVAVHPDDERYRRLIGKKVQLPLTQRTIPIIADASVDREFGTGCVKITPAHDFNDYNTGKRHQLPVINIMTDDAHLNENVPAAYRGLDRFVARKKIIADLKNQNLLEKSEPHRLSVPRGEKSAAIIEPLLTDQWFIKMESLAKPALDAVKQGQLKFVPNTWEKTYLQWLENIQDWCISRQLWWGHQLPVWYDAAKNIYVGHDENEVRQYYKLPIDLPLQRESDVLDTWFSASLWPFASLGWPEKTDEFKTFYPTQTLVTGFDIIFFWVARMVMMGLKLTDKIPFAEVYITGLIRDYEGKKMSKSKGNVLDPIDLIDGIDLQSLIQKRTATLLQPKMAKAIENNTRKEFPQGISAYGTDALRFTFCALASTGRDINFDMGRVEGYRNFCNKLWNAARFVIMHTEGHDVQYDKPLTYSLADQWIRSLLQKTIQQAEMAYATYRFDLLAQTLYEFTWNEFCDWYLELTKCVLNDKNATAAQLRGTRSTLLEILETLLRLLHPIMPFITEEIWHPIAALLGKTGKTIALEKYPEANEKEIDTTAEEEMDWVKQVIITIRTLRSEMGISPANRITVICNKGNDKDAKRVAAHDNYIKLLTKTDDIHWAKTDEILTNTATGIINKLEIHIPLAGMIDKQTELARLQKEISKLEKDHQKLEQMLQNQNYIEKAPAAIVEKERKNFAHIQEVLKKLRTQYKNIEQL